MTVGPKTISPRQDETAWGASKWLARAVITLAAWVIAFVIVLTLLLVAGPGLESLPAALNALVFTGVLVPIMGNVVMPRLNAAVGHALKEPTPGHHSGSDAASSHPKLDALPEWPPQTIGVLVTIDDAVHAIPVSAPLRSSEHCILLSLHRSRGTLSRLRDRPQVALVILAGGNIAFTARGNARVIREHMTPESEYSAVAIDVNDIDDHRQSSSVVDAGVDRRWLDDSERSALRQRVEALRDLSTTPSLAAGAKPR